MKKCNLFALFIVLLFFGLVVPACPDAGPAGRADTRTKTYYPGDLVHIAVVSPSDTVKIIAVMPDESRIEMSYDRRGDIWHGHWEVPLNFKKGVYCAKLTATDVEGKNFGGETSPFYIGEPSLLVMVGLKPSIEAGRRTFQQEEKPIQTAIPSKEIWNRTEEPSAAAEIKEEVEEMPPKVAVPSAPAGEKAAEKIKEAPKKRPAAKPKEEISQDKTKLIISARSALARGDFRKAKTNLDKLLKVDPTNPELKSLVKRLNVIINLNKKGP